MKQCGISYISARQIFDSRGTPTVEATVRLQSGACGTAAVPSGASTGQYEAIELRDGGRAFGGKGVTRAVENVNGVIRQALCGVCGCDQAEIDRRMIELDGTPNKAKLGANAILAVSLAAAKAAAAYQKQPLWRSIGGLQACTLPMPMMNILNGGAHAGNNVDIQEFMIIPRSAGSFAEAMQTGCEVYAALRSLLRSRGLETGVGDEGGFAPNLASDEQALQLLEEAVALAGYRVGEDVVFALDAAVSDWAEGELYRFPKSGQVMTRSDMIAYFQSLCERHPIVSLEDPLGECDFAGFTELTEKIGSRVQIVGDDLFVTNVERLQQGIQQKAANAILIKPNQIGTLTETLDAIRTAQAHGYRAILSHRSGETGDTTIADLAVATNAGQIKTGAPCRSERVEKYNRLLDIERMLGTRAKMGKR